MRFVSRALNHVARSEWFVTAASWSTKNDPGHHRDFDYLAKKKSLRSQSAPYLGTKKSSAIDRCSILCHRQPSFERTRPSRKKI